MLCAPVPNESGVYVTEQVAVPDPFGTRLHVPRDPNVPVPPDATEKLTEPPGLLLVPVAVSVTVAVQVVACPTARVEGLQATLVEVERKAVNVTATLFVPVP